MNKKAFTLIELIIVIATISILAAFAFVAVDPGKRIGEANDSERLSEARSLEEAIGKYSIDNLLLPPTITYLEDNIPYMITSAFISDSLYCSEIGENISEVVLGTILEDYLPILPIDPQEEDPNNNGTGYYLIKSYDNVTKVVPCSLYAFPANVPGPPISLSVGAFGVNTVALGWYIPDDDGGSIIYDYSIQYKESTAGTWEIFNDGENTNTWATVAALAADTLYLFQVAAVNDVGISNYGNIVSQQTEPSGESGGEEG